MPAPDYPASARRKNIEGVVVVAIDVHSDGHCENVRLAESSGYDALDDAALSAIRKWKYEARPNEGTVVRRVRFVFKLSEIEASGAAPAA
jgi:protein TonB